MASNDYTPIPAPAPTTTRGVRNNNFGNIRLSDDVWQGQVADQTDPEFVQFESPEAGVRAQGLVLGSYAQRGINTIADIGKTWAPNTENDTGRWIESVASISGVDPNRPLTPDEYPRVMQAMAKAESGVDAPLELFQQAFDQGGRQRIGGSPTSALGSFMDAIEAPGSMGAAAPSLTPKQMAVTEAVDRKKEALDPFHSLDPRKQDINSFLLDNVGNPKYSREQLIDIYAQKLEEQKAGVQPDQPQGDDSTYFMKNDEVGTFAGEAKQAWAKYVVGSNRLAGHIAQAPFSSAAGAIMRNLGDPVVEAYSADLTYQRSVNAIDKALKATTNPDRIAALTLARENLTPPTAEQKALLDTKYVDPLNPRGESPNTNKKMLDFAVRSLKEADSIDKFFNDNAYIKGIVNPVHDERFNKALETTYEANETNLKAASAAWEKGDKGEALKRGVPALASLIAGGIVDAGSNPLAVLGHVAENTPQLVTGAFSKAFLTAGNVGYASDIYKDALVDYEEKHGKLPTTEENQEMLAWSAAAALMEQAGELKILGAFKPKSPKAKEVTQGILSKLAGSRPGQATAEVGKTSLVEGATETGQTFAESEAKSETASGSELFSAGIIGAATGGTIAAAGQTPSVVAATLSTATAPIRKGAQAVAANAQAKKEAREAQEAEEQAKTVESVTANVDQIVTDVTAAAESATPETKAEAYKPAVEARASVNRELDNLRAEIQAAGTLTDEQKEGYKAKYAELTSVRDKLNAVLPAAEPTANLDLATGKVDESTAPELTEAQKAAGQTKQDVAVQGTILRMGTHPEEFTVEQAQELAASGNVTKAQKNFLDNFAEYKRYADKTADTVALEKSDGSSTELHFRGMKQYAASIAEAITNGDQNTAMVQLAGIEKFLQSQQGKLARWARDGGANKTLTNRVLAETKVLKQLTEQLSDSVFGAFPQGTTKPKKAKKPAPVVQQEQVIDDAPPVGEETVTPPVEPTATVEPAVEPTPVTEPVAQTTPPVAAKPTPAKKASKAPVAVQEEQAPVSTSGRPAFREKPPEAPVVDTPAQIELAAQTLDMLESLDPDDVVNTAIQEAGITTNDLSVARIASARVTSEKTSVREAAVKELRAFYNKVHSATLGATGKALHKVLASRGYAAEQVVNDSVTRDRQKEVSGYHNTRTLLEYLKANTIVRKFFRATKRKDTPLHTTQNFLSKLMGDINGVYSQLTHGMSESAKTNVDNFIDFAKDHGDYIIRRMSMAEANRTGVKGGQIVFANLNDLFKDFVIGGKPGNWLINENLLTTMSAVAFDWLASDGVKTSHNRDKDILQLLNRNTEETITDAERLAFAEAGIPLGTLADQLGGRVLTSLGLTDTADANEEYKGQLRMSIGLHLIDALVEQGVLDQRWVMDETVDGVTTPVLYTGDTAPKEQFTKSGAPLRVTRMRTVRINSVSEQVGRYTRHSPIPEILAITNVARENKDLMRDLLQNDFSSGDVYRDPADIPEYTTDTSGHTIPKKQAEALTKYSSEPFDFRHDIMDILTSFEEEQLYLTLGLKDLDGVHVDRAKSVEAGNTNLISDYENAKQIALEFPAGTPMYFRHAVASNGRMQMQGSRFNPQGSKIARHLVAMSAWKSTVDWSSEKSRNQFKSAVAEAFGFGVDKNNQEAANAFFDSLLEKAEVQAGIAAIRSGSVDGNTVYAAIQGGGISALDGLVALSKMDTTKPFEHQLFKENDGITNGTALGLMQYVGAKDMNQLRQMLARTGIGLDEFIHSVGDWISNKNNRDAYQDLTAQVVNYLEAMPLNTTEGGVEYSHATVASALEAVSYILDANSDSFISADGTVGKAGRNFSKPALMIANYGAGNRKIMQEITTPVVAALYSRIEAIAKKHKDILAGESTMTLEDLDAEATALSRSIQLLGQTLDINIPFELDFDNPLNTRISPALIRALELGTRISYGQAVEYYLDSEYGAMKERSRYVNDAVGLAWDAFQSMFAQREAEILATKSGEFPSLTNGEVKDILEELKPYAPVIATALSDEVNDGERTGIWFDGTEKGTLYEGKLGNLKEVDGNDLKHIVKVEFDRTGTTRPGSMVMGTTGRKPERPKAGPAVRMIHALDSAAMVEILLKRSVMNVHDAIITNAGESIDSTVEMNEGFFDVNARYSVLEATLKAVKTTLDGYVKVTGDTDFASLNFNFKYPDTDERITPTQFIAILEGVTALVAEDKAAVYPRIMSILQYNAEGAMYSPSGSVVLSSGETLAELAKLLTGELDSGTDLNKIPSHFKYVPAVPVTQLSDVVVGTEIEVEWTNAEGVPFTTKYQVTSVADAGPGLRNIGFVTGRGKQFLWTVDEQGYIHRYSGTRTNMETTRITSIAPGFKPEVETVVQTTAPTPLDTLPEVPTRNAAVNQLVKAAKQLAAIESQIEGDFDSLPSEVQTRHKKLFNYIQRNAAAVKLDGIGDLVSRIQDLSLDMASDMSSLIQEMVDTANGFDRSTAQLFSQANINRTAEASQERSVDYWQRAVLDSQYIPKRQSTTAERDALLVAAADTSIEQAYADRKQAIKDGTVQGDEKALTAVMKSIRAKARDAMGSSNGNTRAGQFADAHQDITSDTAVDLFNDLLSEPGHHDTQDHQNHLRTLLSTINRTLLRPLKLYKRSTRTGEESSGEIYFNESAIYMAVSKVKQFALEMSAEEIYVHEILHAAIRHGIEGTSVASSELNTLYKRAKQFIKVEDFLDDPSNTSDLDALAQAKKRYDYIFNNPGHSYIETNVYNGTHQELVASTHLHEFAVIGATNANFRRALSRMDARAPKRALKGLTTAEKIMEVIQRFLHTMSDLVVGRHGQKADDYLLKLIEKLAAVENSTARKKHQGLERIGDAAVASANKIVDTTVSSIETLVQSRFVKSGIKPIRVAGKAIESLATHNTAGLMRAMKEVADKMDIQHDGIIAAMVRELKGATPSVQRMHRMILKANRVIDQTRTRIMTSYGKYLNGMFSEPVDAVTSAAITRALIKTDFEMLVSQYGLARATEFLSDPTALSREISVQQRILRTTQPDYVFYTAMAEGLGYFIANGRALKKHVLFNATQIANMDGTSQSPSGSVQAAIPVIDTLASLYALKYTSKQEKASAKAIIDKETDWANPGNPNTGIMAVLTSHKEMKNLALFKTFGGNPRMMRKGYIKETFNPNVDLQVADTTKGQELIALGYERLHPVNYDPAMPHQNKTGMHYYILRDGAGVKYMSGAISTTGKNAAGTSLIGVNEQANVADPTLGAYIDTLVIRRNRAADIADIIATGGQNVAPGENIVTPIINENGAVAGYRYMMDESTRINTLDRYDDFAHVLGTSFANITDKINTKSLNEELLDMTHARFASEYQTNPKDFIVMSAKSSNKERQDHYRMLPSDARAYAKKLYGGDYIFVHKDDYALLFGYRAFSVSQLRKSNDETARGYALLKQEMNNAMVAMFNNRIGRKGEAIWQEVVRTVKDSIVIKSVVVTTANIGSNMMLLKMLGVPIKDIVRDQAIAYRSAVKYQQDSFKIFDIEQKIARGITGTELAKAKQDIRELQNELRMNPVRELIEAGVLQTIVDDVNTVEDPFSYKSSLDKAVEPFLNKVPTPIVAGAKAVLVTHDTQLYRVLRDAAQLSDFAARYALHKYNTTRRDNPMDATESIDMVVDTFVNYDLPTHKSLQYMNDMGMVMFTKYYLRTQKVILRLAKEKPGNLLLALMAQSMFFDVPDVTDSFITETSVLGKFNFNPVELLSGAAETAPINLVLD